MKLQIVPTKVNGLGKAEAAMLQKLLDVFNKHQINNHEKNRYYDGKSRSRRSTSG